MVPGFILSQIDQLHHPSSSPDHLSQCWSILPGDRTDRDLTICWHLFINRPCWVCLFNQLCVNHPTLLLPNLHFFPSVPWNIHFGPLAYILCSVVITAAVCLSGSDATTAGGHGLFFFFEYMRYLLWTLGWTPADGHIINLPAFLFIPVLILLYIFVQNYTWRKSDLLWILVLSEPTVFSLIAVV